MRLPVTSCSCVPRTPSAPSLPPPTGPGKTAALLPDIHTVPTPTLFTQHITNTPNIHTPPAPEHILAVEYTIFLTFLISSILVFQFSLPATFGWWVRRSLLLYCSFPYANKLLYVNIIKQPSKEQYVSVCITFVILCNSTPPTPSHLIFSLPIHHPFCSPFSNSSTSPPSLSLSFWWHKLTRQPME